MSQVDGDLQPEPSSQVDENVRLPASSTAVATSESARQKRKIAHLEEKLQVLESGHAVKERESNHYVSQGRAIRWIVTLFDGIEALIAENDRRCDNEDKDSPSHNSYLPQLYYQSQDHLQAGYIALNNALPWFHHKASEMEYEEHCHMLKKLRQGDDSARGDDTSKLKCLVADWINRDLKPDPPVDFEDKHYRGFINDGCGRLLCPTELDWDQPTVRAGIRDHADGYIVTEMSWPRFLYDGYTTDPNNLEEGLFKSKLLLQAFKAIFTSPSSAKEVVGDGDGANVIENNRRTKKNLFGQKVKTHLRFALSSVTSWHQVDGDFDYAQFWCNIIDFFEQAPGRLAQCNVDRLLAWWTRKVFGTSQCAELSDTAKASMSVNALAMQRV
ncbi:hypothetical protein F4604DRAFT_1576096 [Suillus subluteus]|nr:hypothetical protein F4604DRAFT_1576096 [Suillus subluteus]